MPLIVSSIAGSKSDEQVSRSAISVSSLASLTVSKYCNFSVGTKHMMEEGAPTTIDGDCYQHNQQPIPSTEDGEPAAIGLPAGNHHEQRSTPSTPSITP